MNYKKIFNAVGVVAVAAVFSTGCSEKPDNEGENTGGYTGSYGSVEYGGKTYKTVKIGTQTWFAENLNYDVPNIDADVCYNNSADSCAKYGRLYDWSTAMGIDTSYNRSPWSGSDVKHQGICPSGWHLPSDAEWSTLENYVGGSSTAATKLKSTSGWKNNGNGTNQYGFSALPGGYNNGQRLWEYIGEDGGGSDFTGVTGRWWSTTEELYDTPMGVMSTTWFRDMGYEDKDVYRGDAIKDYLFSVRCVQG